MKWMYSSPCQIAPRQIAPSLEIAPVFRAGVVVQFGDLAQNQFQIEVCKIIQIGSNKTIIYFGIWKFKVRFELFKNFDLKAPSLQIAPLYRSEKLGQFGDLVQFGVVQFGRDYCIL